MTTIDPIEAIIEAALRRANIEFRVDVHPGALDGVALDFYLPNYDLYIETKQFHSPRIATQMKAVENVIAIQGRAAAEWFAAALAKSGAVG